MAPSKTGRQTVTLDMKSKILGELAKGASTTQLKKKFQVSSSMITRVRKNKASTIEKIAVSFQNSLGQLRTIFNNKGFRIGDIDIQSNDQNLQQDGDSENRNNENEDGENEDSDNEDSEKENNGDGNSKDRHYQKYIRAKKIQTHITQFFGKTK